MDLRDFESILIFFSEEEIEELQAAIDHRRNLVLAKGNLLRLSEQSDYSSNRVEVEVFPEVHIQHPA